MRGQAHTADTGRGGMIPNAVPNAACERDSRATSNPFQDSTYNSMQRRCLAEIVPMSRRAPTARVTRKDTCRSGPSSLPADRLDRGDSVRSESQPVEGEHQAGRRNVVERGLDLVMRSRLGAQDPAVTDDPTDGHVCRRPRPPGPATRDGLHEVLVSPPRCCGDDRSTPRRCTHRRPQLHAGRRRRRAHARSG